MIDDLRALAVFAKTVESGSFRSAAKALKLSPSVVSHHVSRLESRLGVALLYRSTRRLSLTHEGEQLFAHAKTMLDAAEAGFNTINKQSNTPSGKLSITIAAVLARSPLLKQIAQFAITYPNVELSINFSDLPQDLIRDGIDIAIRIGQLQDSELKSKKLFNMKRKLVASPEYVKQHKQARQPSDLCSWEWIGLKMRPNYKLLLSQQGDTQRIDYQPRITVDGIDAVSQLAIAGLGLATPPDFLIESELKQGQLVEPLPDWHPDALGVYALWPPNAPRESLTFRFLRFLTNAKP